MSRAFQPDFSHVLGAVALAPAALGVGVLIAMIIAVPAARARDLGADGETHTTTVRVVGHDGVSRASPALIRARIERAALDLCGGGDGALREINRVVRASPCWRDAVAGALASAEPKVRSASSR